MEIPDHVTCLLRNLYAGQEATVRNRHGTTYWFQIGKGVRQSCIFCHSADLTYMQNTSCEMPGWMKHKLESRLPGEVSITSDMQMTPPLWQKAKRNWRASWWKWTKFMSIASMMPSSHLILWHPLLLLPSIFPSIRDFSNETAVWIRWPKYFSFSISFSNKYLGLISLKINLFYLLVSKGLQESSPAPQFKGINSLVLCLPYGPAVTAVCDHWEDQSLIYRALSAEQCLCFSMHCLDLSWLSCQEAIVFWFHGCSHHPQWF